MRVSMCYGSRNGLLWIPESAGAQVLQCNLCICGSVTIHTTNCRLYNTIIFTE